jgi:Mg2+/Co2+ transporter CorB
MKLTTTNVVAIVLAVLAVVAGVVYAFFPKIIAAAKSEGIKSINGNDLSAVIRQLKPIDLVNAAVETGQSWLKPAASTTSDA